MVSMLCIYVLSTFSVVYREKKTRKRIFVPLSAAMHTSLIYLSTFLFFPIYDFPLKNFYSLNERIKLTKKKQQKTTKNGK